jgi:hypothetical protein
MQVWLHILEVQIFQWNPAVHEVIDPFGPDTGQQAAFLFFRLDAKQQTQIV